jgi:LPXTG-motif cell wall-anchored protein
MTFDNKYSSIDVQLKKVDEKAAILGGSTFKLTKKNATGAYVSVSDALDSIEPGDTEATNPVDLGGLGIGEYRLVETGIPDGYVKLSSNVDFEIYKEDGVLKAKLAEGTDPSIAGIDGPGSGEDPIYTITVTNTPGVALPSTGGHGTLPNTLGGLLLMLGSALMYGFRMRRRERRYY